MISQQRASQSRDRGLPRPPFSGPQPGSGKPHTVISTLRPETIGIGHSLRILPVPREQGTASPTCQGVSDPMLELFLRISCNSQGGVLENLRKEVFSVYQGLCPKCFSLWDGDVEAESEGQNYGSHQVSISPCMCLFTDTNWRHQDITPIWLLSTRTRKGCFMLVPGGAAACPPSIGCLPSTGTCTRR